MSDERKQKQLQLLGKRESAFLRLRRTKLGLDDFRTVKVIGKGAFGEVCPHRWPCAVATLAYAPDIGPGGTKNRHGQDLRNEDAEERRNVKEGPGQYA